MKRFIAIFLCVSLLLTAAACGKKQQTADETPDTFKYEIYDDTVTLTEYIGDEDAVVIPTEYAEKQVAGIGAFAFAASSVKEVSVPSAIVLSEDAFANCTTLEKVTLGKEATYIPDRCFAGCSALSQIDASALADCGVDAFKGTALIANNDEDYLVVGDGLLIAWKGGSNAVIPAGVKNITTVFSGDTDLRTVILPDSVASIPAFAFSACSTLQEIMLPMTLESIGENAFLDCSSITSLDIPVGCREISDFAFKNCTNLSAMTIPDSVDKFGDDVFEGDPKLVITTPFDSAAFNYAAEHNIKIG